MIFLAAWTIAVITNTINGCVSLEYFRWVLPFSITDRWDVIRQALFESTITAAVLCVLILPVYCGVTGSRYPARRFVALLTMSGLTSLACHFVLGMFCAIWIAINPGDVNIILYGSSPPGAPVRFAYVAGAIWGVYLGGFATLVICCVGIVKNWRAFVRSEVGRL